MSTQSEIPNKTTVAERSSEADNVESASPHICAGWPPAQLPERECELPRVGLPQANAHGKVAES